MLSLGSGGGLEVGMGGGGRLRDDKEEDEEPVHDAIVFDSQLRILFTALNSFLFLFLLLFFQLHSPAYLVPASKSLLPNSRTVNCHVKKSAPILYYRDRLKTMHQVA